MFVGAERTDELQGTSEKKWRVTSGTRGGVTGIKGGRRKKDQPGTSTACKNEGGKKEREEFREVATGSFRHRTYTFLKYLFAAGGRKGKKKWGGLGRVER